MEMDAARCAVVGPSGMGGFERRSTHCFHNLLWIAQRREHAEELFFHLEPQIFLRRCEAQEVSVSGAFPTLVRGSGIAHLVRTVAEVERMSSIRARRLQEPRSVLGSRIQILHQDMIDPLPFGGGGYRFRPIFGRRTAGAAIKVENARLRARRTHE